LKRTRKRWTAHRSAAKACAERGSP
jgi:hypothetical protein